MAAVTAGVVTAGAAVHSARESKKAASEQKRAGRAAIRSQEESEATAREDLRPFSEFGSGLIPQLESRLSDPTTIEDITSDPLFDALFGESTRAITANKAARGKLGSGETLKDLTTASLGIGSNIHNQRTRDLFNAIALGQNAAARQATGTLQTGARVGDLQTQIGNVSAAGRVGSANAITQGINTGIGLFDLLNSPGA